jgi:hypothetical protein
VEPNLRALPVYFNGLQRDNFALTHTHLPYVFILNYAPPSRKKLNCAPEREMNIDTTSMQFLILTLRVDEVLLKLTDCTLR